MRLLSAIVVLRNDNTALDDRFTASLLACFCRRFVRRENEINTPLIEAKNWKINMQTTWDWCCLKHLQRKVFWWNVENVSTGQKCNFRIFDNVPSVERNELDEATIWSLWKVKEIEKWSVTTTLARQYQPQWWRCAFTSIFCISLI